MYSNERNSLRGFRVLICAETPGEELGSLPDFGSAIVIAREVEVKASSYSEETRDILVELLPIRESYSPIAALSFQKGTHTHTHT